MAVSVIEVLGPGCARCHETHRVVRHVVEEARLDCLVQKSESVERMVELGVLKTPAVAFDGKVVFSGRIPKSEEVRQLLGLS
jgi:small redox-active disulfide protein 2